MCIVIGLTGLSGSGKSEIANYLEEKNTFGIIRLGTYMRKLYKDDNYDGDVETYAEHFRFSTVAKFILDDINRMQNEGKIIIVDSLRTIADYNFFKEYTTNFKLIMVLADREQRIKRLSNRRRTGDSNDALKLQGHDYWEMSFGIDKLMVLVDKFVLNNRSIQELNQEIEQYIAYVEKFC